MAQRTLITLAIGLTVLAFLAAEADFWSGHSTFRDAHYHSTLLTSFRVAHRGEIELDASESEIVRMSADASLDVHERRLTSRRRLEVRPDAQGRPTYSFTVGARQRSAEEGRAYLAGVLDEIVRTTTVGATARAERLLREGGVERVLAEIPRLDSNAARRLYLEAAAAAEGLEPRQAADIIRTAGAEMTSSSRLRATLVELAERLPLEWQLGGELAEAASHIASSSEKSGALLDVARLRPPAPGEAVAFGRSVASIDANSEKAEAILRLHGMAPSAELTAALVDAAATISSSSETRRVLAELAGRPGLPEGIYARALEVAAEIASSHEKAQLLTTLAAALPPSDELRSSFLDVTESIASSDETKRAMLALLGAADLPAPVCGAWLERAGRVAASSVTADLLVAGAARCPSEPRVWRTYIDVVEGIAASSEQRRALTALLDRTDLDAATLAQVGAAAERSIASSSEREAVLERLAGRPAA